MLICIGSGKADEGGTFGVGGWVVQDGVGIRTHD